MNHRRTALLVLLSALVAFGMSACDSGPAPGQVFNGGTNGLLFSFESNTPPEFIYDNAETPFEIMVRAKNDGEFDTRNILWTIEGINTNEFEGLTRSDVFTDPITGTTKLQDEVIEGEEAYIPIAEDVCYFRSLTGGGSTEYTITANMCYAYATLATSTICVRDNYLDGNSDICDPSETGQVSVSGAPVTITSFSQQAVGPNKLRIQYEVALKDNVEIWAPRPGQVCDGETRSERINNQNYVYVRMDSNGLGNIDCVNLLERTEFSADHIFTDYPQSYLTGNAIIVSEVERTNPAGEGYLRLGSDNTATLTCTMDVKQNLGDSLSTIETAIAYYVKDTIQTDIEVTHTQGSGVSACSGRDLQSLRAEAEGSSGSSGSGSGDSSGSMTFQEEWNACYDECYARSIARGIAGSTAARECTSTCNNIVGDIGVSDGGGEDSGSGDVPVKTYDFQVAVTVLDEDTMEPVSSIQYITIRANSCDGDLRGAGWTSNGIANINAEYTSLDDRYYACYNTPTSGYSTDSQLLRTPSDGERMTSTLVV